MNAIIMKLTGWNISQSNKSGRNNPWVIGWAMGLGTVVFINIIMIITAFMTTPGLVDEDYYETGRKYEQNALSMMAARDALQWQVKLDLPDEIVLSKPTFFTFSAVDVRGLPIDGADLTIVSFRPSDADADFTTKMNEYAPGLYDAEMIFTLKGIWDLNVTMTRNEDTYSFSHRISVLAL